MPSLRITSGPGTGQTVEVDHQIVVGREGDDLSFDDPELSRRHALICPGVPDGLTVQDLGSRNGTFVNGNRITAATPLRPGDEIALGATTLRVRAGDVPADPPDADPARPMRRPALRVVEGWAP